MVRFMVLAVLLGLPGLALAADPIPVPTSLQPFVAEDHSLLTLKRADLNGDGLEDILIVTQESGAAADPADAEVIERGLRTLTILLRDKAGTYAVAATNAKVVFCETCGGVFGDPFNDVTVKPKDFTVHLYGGSNWRWGYDYRFSYSRIDQAWELVKVTETSFHTAEPDAPKVEVYTPRDFGKIKLQDFDPETYR